MVKAKIIGPIKGPNGGFFVDESHSKIILKDIVIAIDGDHLFSGYSLELPNCSEKNPCPLHFDVIKIRQDLDRMLGSKSLKHLAVEVIKGETKIAIPV